MLVAAGWEENPWKWNDLRVKISDKVEMLFAAFERESRTRESERSKRKYRTWKIEEPGQRNDRNRRAWRKRIESGKGTGPCPTKHCENPTKWPTELNVIDHWKRRDNPRNRQNQQNAEKTQQSFSTQWRKETRQRNKAIEQSKGTKHNFISWKNKSLQNEYVDSNKVTKN